MCVRLTYWIWITQYNNKRKHTARVCVFNLINLECFRARYPVSEFWLCHCYSLHIPTSRLAMHKRKQPDVDIMWHNFPLTAPASPSITQKADSSSSALVRPSCDTIIFLGGSKSDIDGAQHLAAAGCSRRLAISSPDWLNTIGSRFSNSSQPWTAAKSLSQRCRKCWDWLWIHG